MHYQFQSSVVKRTLVYGIIGVIAFAILMLFSQPNRLAHDQIDHTLIELTREDPSLFAGDYLWGSPGRSALDNVYSLRLIERFSDFAGGREVGRWLLVPIVFFFFTVGMTELCYAITKRWLVSLGVAIVSNVHVVVFLSEWGLPGPTEVDPWAFVAMVYPVVFLLFYFGVTRRRELFVVEAFCIVGVLGNFHLISMVNILGVFGFAYWYWNRCSVQACIRVVGYSLLALVCALPFIVHYFGALPDRLYSFNPADAGAWDVLRAAAGHVTIDGRIHKLGEWFVTQWWILIPGFLLALVALHLGNRRSISDEQRTFARFGWVIIGSTLLFTVVFSLVQVARLYLFHEYPEFNEPRGVHLMYIVFFVSAAIVAQVLISHIARKVRVGWGVVGIFVCLGFFGLFAVYYQPVLDFFHSRTNLSYTFETCDSEVFRRLSHVLELGDVIMVDPSYYSAIRVCLRYPIVVHSRDRATAYVHGSDVVSEWYRRFHDVTEAFQLGGEALLAAARRYGARVVVSRQCVAISENDFVSVIRVPHATLGHEGCVYVVEAGRLSR